MDPVSVYCSMLYQTQYYIGSSQIGLARPFSSNVQAYVLGLASDLVFEDLITL